MPLQEFVLTAQEAHYDQTMVNFAANPTNELLQELMVRFTPLFKDILRNSFRHSDPDEIIQRTWVIVVQKACTYKPGMKVKNWLVAIMRHLVISDLRKQGKATILPLMEGYEPLYDQRPDQELLTDELEIQKRRSHQHFADLLLAFLPPETSQMLEWRYVHDMPSKEIAEKTGMSDALVRKKLERAKNKIRAEATALGINFCLQ